MKQRVKEEVISVDWETNQKYDLQEYTYFDEERLIKSLGADSGKRMKADQIIEESMIKIDDVQVGYDSDKKEPLTTFYGKLQFREEEFDVSVTISQDEVLERKCECPKCGRFSYYTYYPQDVCEHVTALLKLGIKFAKSHAMADATTKDAAKILAHFKSEHVQQTVAIMNKQNEAVSMEPKLIKNADGFQVSFKIGTHKKYIIKVLQEFHRRMQNGEMGSYGSGSEILHVKESFDEASRKMATFIGRSIEEELAITRYYMNKNMISLPGTVVGQTIALTGNRMDHFFELVTDMTFEYERSNGTKKEKRKLMCLDENPEFVMTIEKNVRNGVIEGIHVQMITGDGIVCDRNSYTILGNVFYHLSNDCAKVLNPFLLVATDGVLSMKIGRNNLSTFYYYVLPQLSDFVEVIEKDTEEVRGLMPPKAELSFYLDAEDNNVTCKIKATYNEESVDVLERLKDTGTDEKIGNYARDQVREQEAIDTVRNWLAVYDEKQGFLHCNKEEDKIYEFIQDGVEALLPLGEVNTTDSFRGIKVNRRSKVSVGVSVSEGLLNLDISTDLDKEELTELLKSMRMRKIYHRLTNGDFINLKEPSMAMLFDLVETLKLDDQDILEEKIKVPAYRALYLDRLLDECSASAVDRDSRFRQLLRDFKTVADAEYELPDDLKNVLRNYQKTGYEWMRTMAHYQFGGILADDMGLGKTLQMIAVLLASKEEGIKGTSLIVCPASLVFNWEEELKKFAPDLNVCVIVGGAEERAALISHVDAFDVCITSYDLCKRDVAAYQNKEFLFQIIDEAQYIKNHTTQGAKAVKVINAKYKFALTGTPIENRLSELWSIFDYLMPGFLYEYEAFKDEFEIPIAKFSDTDSLERLRRMVQPFILRRLKENVLKDLPPKLEETHVVKFSGEQKRLYDAQILQMKERLGSQSNEEFDRNKIQVFAELMRIRQICCDPTLCFENFVGESAKKEACIELIESAIEGGHKILLFSQFTSMLDVLAKELKLKGIDYYMITGATAKKKRVQMVNEFNKNDVPIFLISLKAGGTGLNLTGADIVIHYDPWWNIAAQNQATDRAHRIGQQKIVTVYKLIMKDSIEEKICKLQETKKELADQIITEEVSNFSGFTREDFLELLS